MRRTSMTAALAAMLVLGAPAAFAATATATSIQPGQMLATDVKGADIYGSDNKNIATVKDIILDQSGRVAAIAADVDGKVVALGMKDLDISTDKSNKPHIAVKMTKDQLKSAQAFDLDSKDQANKAAGSGSTAPANPARH